MKKLLFIVVFIQLSSCIYGGDDDYVHYTSQYEPITEARSTFHQRINLESSRNIINAGKIYIKDQHLFLVEPNEGIHVFDNSDRTNPQAINFITVTGITDLAIKNNLMYVHHLQDLVVLNYDPVANNLSLINVTENAFPALNSPDGFEADYFQVEEDQIIIGYQQI